MTSTVFDLDVEITQAQAPSAEEIAADPVAAMESELRCSLTSPTINTYPFGLAMCHFCCA